jgi:acetyltransferase-like isoleucine patch superfamily enzyme
MFQRTLIRLVRAPRSLTRLVLDRFVIPFWVRTQGVETGVGCRFSGYPLVRRHPQATVRLGDGVLLGSLPQYNPSGIGHAVVLTASRPASRITIGNDTGINGASIVAWHSISIGDRCMIGAGTRIWDNDGHAIDPQVRRDSDECWDIQPVVIEDDVFIGAGSFIGKGVTVGSGAVIGAHSAVRRDVPPGTLVVGNPARVAGWAGAKHENDG